MIGNKPMRSTLKTKAVVLALAALASASALALGFKIVRTVEAELNKHDAVAEGWVAGTVRIARGERVIFDEPREER